MSRKKKTQKTARKAAPKAKERRGSYRRQATFPADITRVNQFNFKNKWDHEVGVNIGLSGLCVRSSKALPEKANVTLSILLHNEDAELVEVDAKLVWTQRRVENREKLYYMGLEFTKLASDVRALIERFVNERR